MKKFLFIATLLAISLQGFTQVSQQEAYRLKATTSFNKANKGDSVQVAVLEGLHIKKAYVADLSRSKIWMALVSQTATATATAKVLENTLGGTITIARTGTGVYTFTLTGAFTADKTWFSITQNGAVTQDFVLVRTSANVLTLTTYNASGAAADALLSDTPMEIRVYK